MGDTAGHVPQGAQPFLESGDALTLGEPAGFNHLADSLDFFLAQAG